MTTATTVSFINLPGLGVWGKWPNAVGGKQVPRAGKRCPAEPPGEGLSIGDQVCGLPA